MDDILIRISSPFKAINVFDFLTTTPTEYGMEIDLNKSEIHAMNLSPHFCSKSRQGLILCTYHEQGSPHTHYKYLGVHFYTQDSLALLTDVITNEIHSLVSELAPPPPQMPRDRAPH